MRQHELIDTVQKELATLNTYTFAGSNFVNECKASIAKRSMSLKQAVYIVESASKINDAKLQAWSNNMKSKFGVGSLQMHAQMVCEDLEASDSANQAAAAEAIEDIAATSDAGLAHAIVNQHLLDNWSMYPEVAQLIAAAKQIADKTATPVERSKAHPMLSVVADDRLYIALYDKWYAIVNDEFIETSEPTDPEIAALAHAVSATAFCYDTKRFFAQTCLGEVQVIGDNIVIDGKALSVDAFAERVKQYMQLHQTQLEVENRMQLENDVVNNVMLLATKANLINLIDEALQFDAYKLTVYAVPVADKQFVIMFNSGNCMTFKTVNEVVKTLIDNHIGSDVIDAVKAKWAVLYNSEVEALTSKSAALNEVQSTIVEVKASIADAESKQSIMTADSEGFAAYQIVIDKYKALLARLQTRLTDLTVELENLQK